MTAKILLEITMKVNNNYDQDKKENIKKKKISNETLPTKMRGGERGERVRDQNLNLFDFNINFCTSIEIEVLV